MLKNKTNKLLKINLNIDYYVYNTINIKVYY